MIYPNDFFWLLFFLVLFEISAVGCEKSEKDRFEFHGEEKISHVDGSLMTYFPASESIRRLRWSILVVSFMIIVDISGVTGIFWLKWFLLIKRKSTGVLAQVPTVANSLFMMVGEMWQFSILCVLLQCYPPWAMLCFLPFLCPFKLNYCVVLAHVNAHVDVLRLCPRRILMWRSR